MIVNPGRNILGLLGAGWLQVALVKPHPKLRSHHPPSSLLIVRTLHSGHCMTFPIRLPFSAGINCLVVDSQTHKRERKRKSFVV
ncbi:hypothetical protein BX600DRAFT_455426 [Xylariales sp. PMI_506]|nr:hypothetical protein BX600DRAFT_455426 [Xylariales sp. PMI_506]